MGDKTRMEKLTNDESAFIRPSPSAGSLGGVAQKTRESIILCEAASYEVILVETVGVGQSEVEIMRVANTVCVVLAPGMGDGIQAAKAGLLEIGDIYLVNKSDREGALETKQDIEKSIALSMLKTTKGVNWTPID